MRNVNFAWLTNANFLQYGANFSHAKAGATDEGEDEGGDPGQHHVWAAAEEIFVFLLCFSNISKTFCT